MRHQPRLLRYLPVLLTLVLTASIVCLAGQPNRPGSPAVTYAYVGTATGSGNANGAIYGFAVAADGSAQAVPGSPFTGPSSLLTPVANYVYATPQFGTSIATWTRAADGSLRATSVVSDLRNLPYDNDMYVYALNPDRAGQTLNSVISCNSCNSYVVPWKVQGNGQLSFLGTPSLPDNEAKWSGVFFFSADDRYAYTDTDGGFGVYKRNANGSLSNLPDSGAVSPPLSPSDGNQVCYPGDVASSAMGYVALVWWGSEYWCDNDGYLLGSYTVGVDGALNLVPGLGVSPSVQEKAMAFDPTGTYLAIAGTIGNYPTQGAVQVYKLQQNGSLSAVGQPVMAPGVTQLNAVSWDASNHVYAVGYQNACAGQCGLYVFNSSAGELTLAPGTPAPVENVVSLGVAANQ